MTDLKRQTAEMLSELNSLELDVRKSAAETIVEINPLSRSEAFNTELRLLYMQEDLAVFWSNKLKRPAFLIAEAECCDEDEAEAEISISCHYGSISSYLKRSATLRGALLEVTGSNMLRQYCEKLDKLALTKEQYNRLNRKKQDLEILARLTQQYGEQEH